MPEAPMHYSFAGWGPWNTRGHHPAVHSQRHTLLSTSVLSTRPQKCGSSNTHLPWPRPADFLEPGNRNLELPQLDVQKSGCTGVVQRANIQGAETDTTSSEQDRGLPCRAGTVRISLGDDLRSLTSPTAGRTTSDGSRGSVNVVPRHSGWCANHGLSG